MKKSITLLSVLLIVLMSNALRADDATTTSATMESRLRAALQDSAQQLQDAQTQLAAAQAAQTQSDKDKADLQVKLDAATAQVAQVQQQDAADKADAAAAATDFNAKIGDLNKQLVTYKSTLDAWMKDDKANAELAAQKEAARAQLAAQNIGLLRTVDDRETENIALYNLGNDILTRYQNFGLGDALAAKEPFIGTSRVKLQTLVQDYRDKLVDHVITRNQPQSPIVPIAPAAPANNHPAASAHADPAGTVTAVNP